MPAEINPGPDLPRERTETLGTDRLGDLVLDLSVDELAAWLADPNAR